MAKRGRRGQGSVFQRTSDKLWVARVRVSGGQRTEYARTKAEAEIKRRELLSGPAPRFTADQTVADFLQSWYETEVEGTVRAGTADNYQTGMKQIARHVGDVRLSDLNPERIARLYRDMRQTLAPGTVRRNHVLLKRALRKAVAWGYLSASPLEDRRAPKVESRELDIYTEDELYALISHAAGGRWHALWVVLGSLGLRISEALGLQWNDIDWSRRTMRIQRGMRYQGDKTYAFEDLKNESSRRTLHLSAMELDALRSHRTLMLATRETPFEDRGLIFCRPNGLPLNRQVPATNLDHQADALGLRRVRLHDLRHTAATVLLKHGVPVKVVSEMLGHGDVLITLRTYAHVTESMQLEASRQRELIWQRSAERATMEHEDETGDELSDIS